MKTIKIYGSGCNNCELTAARIEEVAKELGLQVAIEKETSLEAIMRAGVMSTPAIGIDGEIKHTGSVPNFDQVRKILEQNAVA